VANNPACRSRCLPCGRGRAIDARRWAWRLGTFLRRGGRDGGERLSFRSRAGRDGGRWSEPRDGYVFARQSRCRRNRRRRRAVLLSRPWSCRSRGRRRRCYWRGQSGFDPRQTDQSIGGPHKGFRASETFCRAGLRYRHLHPNSPSLALRANVRRDLRIAPPLMLFQGRGTVAFATFREQLEDEELRISLLHFERGIARWTMKINSNWYFFQCKPRVMESDFR